MGMECEVLWNSEVLSMFMKLLACVKTDLVIYLFNISVTRTSDDNSCGDILLLSRTSSLRVADQFWQGLSLDLFRFLNARDCLSKHQSSNEGFWGGGLVGFWVLFLVLKNIFNIANRERYNHGLIMKKGSSTPQPPVFSFFPQCSLL